MKAFAGKSNGGKIIHDQCAVKPQVARKDVGANGGKTQTINFTMSMMPCIWSICPVMDMQRPLPAREGKWGKMIENYSILKKTVGSLFADRYPP